MLTILAIIGSIVLISVTTCGIIGIARWAIKRHEGKVKQDSKSEGGFTLIELLIVIAICGILAAIAVPQYQAFRDQNPVQQRFEQQQPKPQFKQQNDGKLEVQSL